MKNCFDQIISNFFKDVVCLQELWEPADRTTVISSLVSAYPYSVQAGGRNATCSDPCTPDDSEKILGCAYTDDCLTAENPFSCIIRQCNVSFPLLEKKFL